MAPFSRFWSRDWLSPASIRSPLPTALGLGAVVVVLAPLGDLVESVVKRDLGLKDMGRLLPRTGVFRTGLMRCSSSFPATFVFFRLVHLG